MKKPAWISFCGWAVIALVSFFFGGILVGSQLHWAPTFAAVCVLLALLSIPFFCLWLLGSIVFSFQKSKAHVGAEIMARAMEAAREQAAGAGKSAIKSAPQSPMNLSGLGRPQSPGGIGEKTIR